MITKDASGKVHVNKDEMATRHGGWGGAAAGAVIGILFPPAIIGSAVVGGAIGGIGGHLWRGLSRSDVKELGELIDSGEAALMVIGASTLEAALDKAKLKAEKHVAKQLGSAPTTSTPPSKKRPPKSADLDADVINAVRAPSIRPRTSRPRVNCAGSALVVITHPTSAGPGLLLRTGDSPPQG